MPAVCFCCWDTFIPCVRTRFNVLLSRDSQFLIISLILYYASKSRCFSSSAGEAVRSQLAGRQPVEQPGRVTPALESGTSKWLHAHVPTAAGTGCPAFHSTATERIWPQPWQKGGVFLLPGSGTCSVAPGQAVSLLHLGASFAGLRSVAAKLPCLEKGLQITEVRG